MIKVITRIIPEQQEEILIRYCTQCTHFKEDKNHLTSYYCSLNNQLLTYVYKYPIPDRCPLP